MGVNINLMQQLMVSAASQTHLRDKTFEFVTKQQKVTVCRYNVKLLDRDNLLYSVFLLYHKNNLWDRPLAIRFIYKNQFMSWKA